ncbi:Elongator complex protein 5 [Apodemus speciosus]|uniref:Elongator complex protein 5 n=1 Tax=Apodemus speciosus TaxID=105296 RepID=A0ABQ0FAQ9_APOSI
MVQEQIKDVVCRTVCRGSGAAPPSKPPENSEHKKKTGSSFRTLRSFKVGSNRKCPASLVVTTSEGVLRRQRCWTRCWPSVVWCFSEDSVEWEGRSLLKALVKKSVLRGEQVHVLGCEVSEEEFREGFGSEVNSRIKNQELKQCLVYHDLFRDPLNWSKPGEAVPEGPLKALRSMCKTTDRGSVTIALDSLSWLLCHIPCVTLCQALHALSQPNVEPGDYSLLEQVRVLGLLHEELHGPGPMGALNALAHTEVILSGKMGQTSASVLCRRPQQRAAYQQLGGSPFFLTSAWIFMKGFPSILSYTLILTQPRVDPTTHLTFNLHLSKKERETRDSLTLPFQFSSEKQQALLHPVLGQTAGRIFYEPDAFDDVDQEDPDDDLDI